MFVSLDTVKIEAVAPRSARYHVDLIDKDFIERFITPAKYYNDARVAAQIIRIYKNRNRNVVRALVKYYEYLDNCGFDVRVTLADHFFKIDAYDPTLNHKEQYYPLLCRVYLRRFVR